MIGLVIGTTSCTGRGDPQPPSPSADAPPAEQNSQPSTALRESTEPKEAIAPAEATSDETDIWSRLQNADDTHYYVLMRHALAPGTGDPSGFQLNDCSTQRNLSEEGRDQARRTGEAFRENNVTVQRVLSSEWCRCLDTAELLDLGPVERFSGLNSFFQDQAKRPEKTAQLREFMLANQDEYGVTVLVTHFVNISAIAGSGISSGEMVVMQINDQDEPEVVDRIDEF
ncbi:MAG: histidine phosphatase family protein [Leptolyngbyaceae bacterium]|nr:histidine phosphatase family protein [Leptolyngbyaceae bacterium]